MTATLRRNIARSLKPFHEPKHGNSASDEHIRNLLTAKIRREFCAGQLIKPHFIGVRQCGDTSPAGAVTTLTTIGGKPLLSWQLGRLPTYSTMRGSSESCAVADSSPDFNQ
ncbi:hypothetical protein ACFFUC_14350 [Paracoccus cavernae]